VGLVPLWGTNISLADTSVAGGVHLPFTYNVAVTYNVAGGVLSLPVSVFRFCLPVSFRFP
jgi:hypothetical protein